MAGKLGREIYRDRRWPGLRRAALDAAGWRCEKCGRAGRLEAHHKEPIFRRPALAFDINNIWVLCRPCHFATHAEPPTWKRDLQEFCAAIRSGNLKPA